MTPRRAAEAQTLKPLDVLVTTINGAVTARSIYPAGHPRVRAAMKATEEALEAYRGPREDPLTILVIEGEIAIDGTPWRRSEVLYSAFLEALSRHGVERIVAAREATSEELSQLFSGLATDAPLPSSPRIELGRIRSLEQGEGDPTFGEKNLESHVDRVCVELDRLLEARTRSMGALRDATRTLVAALDSDDPPTLVPTPCNDHVDRLWRHSTTVALCAVQLARSLGIGGEVLLDLALAALLHDVGRLDLTAEDPRSAPVDWKQRSRDHPNLAVAWLAALEDVPTTVMVVAGQHHRQPDGRGFPSSDAAIGLASSIVAVADAWEVLFNTAGTLGEERRRTWAVEQLQAMAGTALDGTLVHRFVRLLPRAERGAATG